MSEKRDVDDVIKQLFREHYFQDWKEMEFGFGDSKKEGQERYERFKAGYLLGFQYPFKKVKVSLTVYDDGYMRLVTDGKEHEAKLKNPVALVNSLLMLAMGTIG